MRNPTSSEDYGDAHQRAFHFVRALCLIALIIVHALSFNNRVLMQTSISSIPGGILFHSLGAMNSLFVFLAGVTFRLQLNPFVTGYRLRPGVFATTARMLFMLLCIDLLKNHLVYNTAAVILSWDFLHTLLLSWCAIWALSRIDIRLNLVAAAAISWFHADLRNYFLRGAWTWAEGWPPLDRWNLFHTYSLVAVALSAVILLVLLWRQPWPRPLRFVLTAALSVIVVSFVKSISYFEPGTFDYEMARNWWRYGLVGDPLNYTLMPALTWGPSALIGFGGTDWILRNHATVRGWTPRTTGIISFVTAATLIYILLLRTGAWLHTSGPSTWNTYADSQTSFAGELMKLGHFGTLYSLFWFLCQRIRWPRVDDWALSLSRATFWIYIAATALTQILAQSLSTRSRNLTLNFVLTTALTLLFALFIAYMVNWLATKRIALYLRKAEA